MIKKTLNKSLTPFRKKSKMKSSLQKDNGFSRPFVVRGVSAPFGNALFLCQKFTIIMMGVFWETSVCRTLVHGLLTRFTPIALCLVAFRAGLQSLVQGSDHEQSIQHASRPSTQPLQLHTVSPAISFTGYCQARALCGDAAFIAFNGGIA